MKTNYGGRPTFKPIDRPRITKMVLSTHPFVLATLLTTNVQVAGLFIQGDRLSIVAGHVFVIGEFL